FTSGTGIYWVSLIDYLAGLSNPPVLPYVALAAILLAAASLVVLLRRQAGDYPFAAGALLLTLLLYALVTPPHSWDLLWAPPALCLVPYWPGLLLTATSPVLYAPLGLPQGPRDLVVNSLLYAPFLLAVAIHFRARRGRRQAAFAQEAFLR